MDLFVILNVVLFQTMEKILKSNVKISLSLFPTLLHPKSRGVIRLKSKDPFVYPAIDPNYLEKKEDVEVLIAGWFLGKIQVFIIMSLIVGVGYYFFSSLNKEVGLHLI